MIPYENPYTNATLPTFLLQWCIRMVQLLTGQLSWESLASDEVQILVLMAVSASSALVGTFLVLRRMAMLANALSHTILLGIVLAYVAMRAAVQGGVEVESHQLINIPVMLLASLGMGLFTTFLTQFLTSQVGLQRDASIGIVFTSLFALGIIFATLLTRSAHIGTEVVMGNVDALMASDCLLPWLLCALNILLIALLYKGYQITTFDPGLSLAMGISPLLFDYLLMTQVSATAISAFRAVGVLMFLSFLTAPTLIAGLFTHRLKRLLTCSVAVGALASLFGVALSRHLLTLYGLPLSTGALVVCLLFVAYLLAFGCVQLLPRLQRARPSPSCSR